MRIVMKNDTKMRKSRNKNKKKKREATAKNNVIYKIKRR